MEDFLKKTKEDMKSGDFENFEESKRLEPLGFEWSNPNTEPDWGLESGQYFITNSGMVVLRALDSYACYHNREGESPELAQKLEELGYEKVERSDTRAEDLRKPRQSSSSQQEE